MKLASSCSNEGPTPGCFAPTKCSHSSSSICACSQYKSIRVQQIRTTPLPSTSMADAMILVTASSHAAALNTHTSYIRHLVYTNPIKFLSSPSFPVPGRYWSSLQCTQGCTETKEREDQLKLHSITSMNISVALRGSMFTTQGARSSLT